MNLRMMEELYRPSEDSFLLLKNARKLVRGNILEMGTGTGFIAIELSRLPQVNHVLGVDINPKSIQTAMSEALETGLSQKVSFIQSNLYRNLDNQKFDWILFNPPYLPSEGTIDEKSWAGGHKGGELITQFLLKSLNFLSSEGSILVIISSQTRLNLEDFDTYYSIAVLEEVNLFFETLKCVKLSPLTLLKA
jgi:release factor glutamine methyltransferase